MDMTRAFHGIAVGTERHGERIFFTLKPTGTLTHEDYKDFEDKSAALQWLNAD